MAADPSPYPRKPVRVEEVDGERVTLSIDLPTLAFIAGQMKTHVPVDMVTSELCEAFAVACSDYLDQLLGTVDRGSITLKVTL